MPNRSFVILSEDACPSRKTPYGCGRADCFREFHPGTGAVRRRLKIASHFSAEDLANAKSFLCHLERGRMPESKDPLRLWTRGLLQGISPGHRSRLAATESSPPVHWRDCMHKKLVSPVRAALV